MEQLDAQKLRIELAKINKSHAWLAYQLGFSRQYLGQLVKAESGRCIDDMAKVLKVNPKSLIK